MLRLVIGLTLTFTAPLALGWVLAKVLGLADYNPKGGAR